MAGQPKPAFYGVVLLVVVALVAFAVYRSDIFAPRADKPQDVPLTKNGDKGTAVPTTDGKGGTSSGAEAPDTVGITTVKEYQFKPSERLPPVKGTAAYKAMNDDTVRFALNV